MAISNTTLAPTASGGPRSVGLPGQRHNDHRRERASRRPGVPSSHRRTGATLAVAGAHPALLPALKALDSGGLSIHPDIGAPLSAGHKSDRERLNSYEPHRRSSLLPGAAVAMRDCRFQVLTRVCTSERPVEAKGRASR